MGRCRDFEATLARAKWVKPVEEAIVVGFRDSAERAIPASRPLLAEPGRAIRDVALRALKSSESKAEERRQGGGAKMPVVPAALRRGTPVGHFVVGSVEKTDSSAKIKLVRGRETVEVVLRTHVEGRGYTVRKGPWAVDVAGAENLGTRRGWPSGCWCGRCLCDARCGGGAGVVERGAWNFRFVRSWLSFEERCARSSMNGSSRTNGRSSRRTGSGNTRR
ncbi:MAG: hypothetical protein R3F14_18335 [Polyangiaceae bacterium]